MKVLQSLWFSQYGNLKTIGIVIGKDGDEIKCYIGNGSIGNSEESDKRYIAETGAKFPLDGAKALFPEIFKGNIL